MYEVERKVYRFFLAQQDSFDGLLIVHSALLLEHESLPIIYIPYILLVHCCLGFLSFSDRQILHLFMDVCDLNIFVGQS